MNHNNFILKNGLSFFKDRSNQVYLVISFFALIWAIVTMEYSKPWCDEVMLQDTNANMYFYGHWDTFAYNDAGEGAPPFNRYFPLYTWVMFLWISVFGFSFLKVRLCELITTFLLGIYLLYFGKKLLKKQFSPISVVIFSLAFWFTDIMMLAYRMARPDMLGGLMAVILAIFVLKSLNNNKLYAWQIILFSSLSMASGLQSVVYVFLAFIYALFFVRPIKSLFKPFLFSLLGFMLGFFVSFLFMAYFGQGKGFIVEIMNHSQVLLKTWDFVKGIIYPLLGKTVTPTAFEVSADNITFLDKVLSIFSYFGAILLVAINVVLILLTKAWEDATKRVPMYVFLFSLFVIVGFNLAGRFTSYYLWTAILPLLLSLLIFVDMDKRKIVIALTTLAALVLLVKGISKYSLIGETPCDRINAFIHQQHFKKTDKIATSFATFYALKSTNRYVYFYQIYPQHLIGDVDYIIIPEYEGEYNQKGMEQYLKEYQANPKFKVTKISTMKDPDLAMYKVVKR